MFFPDRIFQGSDFFVFLFFLDAVIPLDRTWHLERSARRILFVTASNYSGTKGNEEGLRRNMAPVYLNATSTRWMHKLLVFFFFPPPFTPKYYTGISHNGKKQTNSFLPCFCSACLHLCLSVWLGRSYWQRALSLVKPRQHLDRKRRKFSCLFCVGSGWRSDAPGPIRSPCSRCTVIRGSVKFIYIRSGPPALRTSAATRQKRGGKEIAFRENL